MTPTGTSRRIGDDFKPAQLDLICPATDWADKPIPERQWIVPGWIPGGGQVTMKSGDGGVGKSSVALDVAAAAATGQQWLGKQVTPCRSLGLYCEDDADEVHRRLNDICRHRRIKFQDLGDMQIISRVAADATLAHFPHDGPAEPTDLFAMIMNQAVNSGCKLVILDSLHDLFAGNENNRSHARQFIALLRHLAVEIDGAVIVTAHPSLSGRNSGTGEAGSTAWNNAVRSRLYLTRPDVGDGEADPDARILYRKKSNYSGIGEAIHMRWSNGVFVADESDVGFSGSVKRRLAKAAFINGLDILTERGFEVSDAKQGSYAPRVILRLPESNGFKLRDLEEAMVALISAGTITLEQYGPPSRKKRKFIKTLAEAPHHE